MVGEKGDTHGGREGGYTQWERGIHTMRERGIHTVGEVDKHGGRGDAQDEGE